MITPGNAVEKYDRQHGAHTNSRQCELHPRRINVKRYRHYRSITPLSLFLLFFCVYRRLYSRFISLGELIVEYLRVIYGQLFRRYFPHLSLSTTDPSTKPNHRELFTSRHKNNSRSSWGWKKKKLISKTFQPLLATICPSTKPKKWRWEKKVRRYFPKIHPNPHWRS